MLAELKPIEERKGKVLIDFAQNSLGRTITAPYSLKPIEGAPVSTPLEWGELELADFDPREFNIRTVPERLERIGDPMLPVLDSPQDLTKAAKILLQKS